MDFELHSLGWKAFQDLCTTILGEVLGQTIQQFSDTHDGGRDGAFGGIWRQQKDEEFQGQFTVQCKFTSKRDRQLTLGDLADEIEKARRLAAKGLATSYMLMTNYRLTGTTDEILREYFQSIPGITHFRAYGYERICQWIRESSKLRMLVPRVYGLGDLSQILDERACAQAHEILSALGDDLAKFVITDAHRRSAKALVEHGFVLLLGEPASGKSTIAAALAVAAIDQWQCRTVKIRDADEFVRHWNPNEPKRFFWVDDAFGATQFDHSLAGDWNRVFPHVYAAIRQGARVLFTSRDYIYRAAQGFIKQSAFPLITESQVIIHVEQLTKPEREQILYNHLKLGRQPEGFRSGIKPHLAAVAAHPGFKPEIARRLGDPLFTNGVALDWPSLDRFVAHPLAHLIEVIRTLDPGSRSALAMVFMRGGSLPSPIDLSLEEIRAAELIGGNPASVRESLKSLNGSLVLNVREDGAYQWRFKHPTVRDAFAAIIGGDLDLLDIYLSGSPPDRLVHEVTCGDVGIQGAKVIIPADRYDTVINRLTLLDNRFQLLAFLSRRCDKRFLQQYVVYNSSFIDGLQVHSFLNAVIDVDVIVRLHEFGLLPEEKRRSTVISMATLAVDTPDAGFLDLEVRSLFTDDELATALTAVRDDLIPNLENVITQWEDDCEPEKSDGHFDPLIECLRKYLDELSDDPQCQTQIQDALVKAEEAADRVREKYASARDNDFYDKDDRPKNLTGARSIFDDIDE